MSNIPKDLHLKQLKHILKRSYVKKVMFLLGFKP